MDLEVIYKTSRLDFLNKRYKELNDELVTIEEKIDRLESKRDSISARMLSIWEEVSKIKKSEINDMMYCSNQADFVKDFVTASHFAANVNNTFYYVKITDCEIIASNKHFGIVIRNENIPKEVRNSSIPWDVRNDFAIYKSQEEIKYPDLKGLIDKEKKEKRKVLSKVSADEVKIKCKVLSEYRSLLKIEIGEIQFIFNKEYFETSIAAMGKELFDIYADESSLGPVIFSGQRKSVIIMPVRYESIKLCN